MVYRNRMLLSKTNGCPEYMAGVASVSVHELQAGVYDENLRKGE